ncbi:unnamed protein product [Acanthoscelides obtectus]|uniref:Uncharacterized protein n=1 Tax=Acanthoscelides obtectus TaxID=200917 RepID=A0A9P0KAZ2_ACAOB|nr:unnamed protein product [Acanthoscelides obtectus]CAK1635031.1 hypothetical protein AOBTE_LOCUS9013 [Acanthoscelides obtectus]
MAILKIKRKRARRAINVENLFAKIKPARRRYLCISYVE